jgi:hypothetical protein
VHESDDFWKENAIKLNDKDHEQLKYVDVFGAEIVVLRYG